MVFDNQDPKPFNLSTLDNSQLTIKSLEIITKGSPNAGTDHLVTPWIWTIYLLLLEFPVLSHPRISYWITPLDIAGPLEDDPIHYQTSPGTPTSSRPHPRQHPSPPSKFRRRFPHQARQHFGSRLSPSIKAYQDHPVAEDRIKCRYRALLVLSGTLRLRPRGIE